MPLYKGDKELALYKGSQKICGNRGGNSAAPADELPDITCAYIGSTAYPVDIIDKWLIGTSSLRYECIRIPNGFNPSKSNNFEIGLKFRTGVTELASNSYNDALVGASTPSYGFAPTLYLRDDGTINLTWYYTSSSRATITVSGLALDTEYNVVFGVESETLFLRLYQNGLMIGEDSVKLTANHNAVNAYLRLGGAGNSGQHPMINSSIYLPSCYYIYNGELVWGKYHAV